MDTLIFGNGYAQTTVNNNSNGMNAQDNNSVVIGNVESTEETGTEFITEEKKAIGNFEGDAAVLNLSKDIKNAWNDQRIQKVFGDDMQFTQYKTNRINKNSNKTKKKRLNYNFQRISGCIMRAKNAPQVSSALALANQNLNTIRSKGASGSYDNDEINIALNHAMDMVRVAKKKLNNVKKEEKEKTEKDLNGKEKKEYRENDADFQNDIKNIYLNLKEEIRQQNLRKKEKNRNEEEKELSNSDMNYLNKKIDLIKQGKGDFSIASVDVSGGMTAISDNSVISESVNIVV